MSREMIEERLRKFACIAEVLLSSKYTVLLHVLIIVFFELVFFRNILANDLLIGDNGDGRLCTLLTEHWYRCFIGIEKFNELPIFFPTEGVIGYTDLFFGFGIIHSVLRIAGTDMFDAFKWTLILVHCFGSFGMYYLLSRRIKIGYMYSLIGVSIFSYSPAYSYMIYHPQLVAVSFLPFFVTYLYDFVENFYNKKKFNFYGCYTIIAYALIAYTSWYIAFFTALFSIITFIVYSLLLSRNGVSVWELIKKEKNKYIKTIIEYFMFAVVVFLPFLYIYLPALKVSGGYGYKGVTPFLPEFIDIINVTSNNFLLGKLISKFELGKRISTVNGEVSEGYTIIILIIFAMLLYFVVKKHKAKVYYLNLPQIDVYKTIFFDSIVVAVFISIILILKLSETGISLWYVIYKFIPGANAVRVVGRFMLWLTFPIAIIVSMRLKEIISKCHFKNKIIAVLCVFVLIFVSNVQKQGVSANWNKHAEMNYIESVAVPPQDCKYFFVVDRDKKSDMCLYQLDAYEIAIKYNLKTLNGYSGVFPKNWMLWRVNAKDYLANVNNWIKINDIKNVYCYDQGKKVWEKYNYFMVDANEILVPNKLNVSIKADCVYHNNYIFGEVSITNNTNDIISMSLGKHPINLGISIIDKDGRIVNQDFMHLKIMDRGILKKGETKKLRIMLPKMDEYVKKGYGIRLGIVQEGVAWDKRTFKNLYF